MRRVGFRRRVNEHKRRGAQKFHEFDAGFIIADPPVRELLDAAFQQKGLVCHVVLEDVMR